MRRDPVILRMTRSRLVVEDVEEVGRLIIDYCCYCCSSVNSLARRRNYPDTIRRKRGSWIYPSLLGERVPPVPPPNGAIISFRKSHVFPKLRKRRGEVWESMVYTRRHDLWSPPGLPFVSHHFILRMSRLAALVALSTFWVVAVGSDNLFEGVYLLQK